MTLTRIQALVIAVGLALVGVTVARAGTEAPPSPGIPGGSIFAEEYTWRAGRPTGDWRLRSPQNSARLATSPL